MVTGVFVFITHRKKWVAKISCNLPHKFCYNLSRGHDGFIWHLAKHSYQFLCETLHLVSNPCALSAESHRLKISWIYHFLKYAMFYNLPKCLLLLDPMSGQVATVIPCWFETHYLHFNGHKILSLGIITEEELFKPNVFTSWSNS